MVFLFFFGLCLSVIGLVCFIDKIGVVMEMRISIRFRLIIGMRVVGCVLMVLMIGFINRIFVGMLLNRFS